jgi:hypothetical protein
MPYKNPEGLKDLDTIREALEGHPAALVALMPNLSISTGSTNRGTDAARRSIQTPATVAWTIDVNVPGSRGPSARTGRRHIQETGARRSSYAPCRAAQGRDQP